MLPTQRMIPPPARHAAESAEFRAARVRGTTIVYVGCNKIVSALPPLRASRRAVRRMNTVPMTYRGEVDGLFRADMQRLGRSRCQVNRRGERGDVGGLALFGRARAGCRRVLRLSRLVQVDELQIAGPRTVAGTGILPVSSEQERWNMDEQGMDRIRHDESFILSILSIHVRFVEKKLIAALAALECGDLSPLWATRPSAPISDAS